MKNNKVLYRSNGKDRNLIYRGVWVYETPGEGPLQLATIGGFEGIPYDEDLILPEWYIMA